MKLILLSKLGVLLALVTVSAQAQVPRGPTFQGAVTIQTNFEGGGPSFTVHNRNSDGDVAIDFLSGPGGDIKGNIAFVRSGPPERFVILQGSPEGLNLTLLELATGNVGIALMDPQHRLDVNGDVNTSGCYKVAGGTISGTCISDRRLKQNIRSLSNSLEKISALQPVRFEWRTEEFPDHRFHSGSETGLVGQNVEEVFPHLVSTDTNGLKRVNYGLELQMQMIQAIKELKTQNDELRARLRKLETRLSDVH